MILSALPNSAPGHSLSDISPHPGNVQDSLLLVLPPCRMRHAAGRHRGAISLQGRGENPDRDGAVLPGTPGAQSLKLLNVILRVCFF